jgi:hypothetical protein
MGPTGPCHGGLPTQTLKQIVWGAILLHDHDDVLKLSL